MSERSSTSSFPSSGSAKARPKAQARSVPVRRSRQGPQAASTATRASGGAAAFATRAAQAKADRSSPDRNSPVLAPWDLPDTPDKSDTPSDFSFDHKASSPDRRCAVQAVENNEAEERPSNTPNDIDSPTRTNPLVAAKKLQPSPAPPKDSGSSRNSDCPRWGRRRNSQDKVTDNNETSEEAVLRAALAPRSQSTPASPLRPNPLLSAATSPSPQENDSNVPGSQHRGRPPPPPLQTFDRHAPPSPVSPVESCSPRSPSRPNPLLAGDPHRTPSLTPPRRDDSPHAETASQASSKKSKSRRSTREEAGAPSYFEPAAFLESMFSASVPTGSSVVEAVSAALSSAPPEQPTRRSTRRSLAAEKVQKSASERPPSRRTQRGSEKLAEGARPASRPARISRQSGSEVAGPSSTRGSLRTSNRIPADRSPRRVSGSPPVSSQRAGAQVECSESAAAVPEVAPLPSRPSEANVGGAADAPSNSERTLAPWDIYPLPASSAESSPAVTHFSTSPSTSPPRRVSSPSKGNKISDRGLVSAKPKPRPKQSTRNLANINGTSPEIPGTKTGSQPVTPSFVDTFGRTRTPSFETLEAGVAEVMRNSFSQGNALRFTAEFGREFGVLCSADADELAKAGVAPFADLPRNLPKLGQAGSPTKDPSRRARFGESLAAIEAIDTGSEANSPKKKVGLASLATRPPVVRFARVQDVAVADRSLLGTKVPAFSQLGIKLHEQRVLGCRWQLDSLDFKALLMWYLPYVALALCYVSIILLVGASSEILLISVPLFVCLPLAHLARLALSERSLQGMVDNGALAEFHDQLKSPVGWSSNAVFMATLGGALQAFQKSFPSLLARPPIHLPMRSAILASGALSFLGFVRAMRVTDISVWVSVEAVFTFVALALVVFFGCSPAGVRDRTKEVDDRLSVLEAAFNTMLDTLRPLMGDLHGGAALQQEPMSPGSALVAFSRFSVRLITQDRNTIRADLHVMCKDSPQLFVSCPLANFAILSDSLEGIAPTDLGVSAASPTTLAAPGGDFSPTRGQGLHAVAASMGIHLGGGRQRRREDDENSTSMASASTASTLRSKRGSGAFQPSEASLKLAMGMVTTICTSSNEPLEAFRPTLRGAVFPPKAAQDEPSLLLAVAADSVQVEAEHTEERSKSFAFLESFLPLSKKEEPAGAVESFGVLRNAEQMECLCRAVPPGASGLTTPTSRPMATPLGRLSSDSDSEAPELSDDDSPRKHRPSAADGYLSQADVLAQHLAVVFDTVEERDRCLSLFEVAGLLPEPSPEWP